MSYYECIKVLSNVWDTFLNSKLFIYIFVILLITAVYMISRFSKRAKINSIVVMGNKISINKKNRKTAYKIYIQLKTRKLTIPFESEDTIVEIYDSWFNAFSDIRELLMEVEPIKDNFKLIYITLSILNDPIRGHLTKWQSKFRRWYQFECEENKKQFPQQIQEKYPYYLDLTTDLKDAQKQIIVLAKELEKIFK